MSSDAGDVELGMSARAPLKLTKGAIAKSQVEERGCTIALMCPCNAFGET